MGAWTNVNVPTFAEWQRDEYEIKLVAERDFWKKQAEQLRDQLNNIPAAVKQYGYCDVTDSNGVTVQLVAKPLPSTARTAQ